MDFVESMANLTLENFDTLTDYELDGRLANIDLRELVEFVNWRILIIPRRVLIQIPKSTRLRQVYPSENVTIHSFSTDAKYNVQQLITEQGVCVSINTPLSKFLMKRFLNAFELFASRIWFFSFILGTKHCDKKI